MAARGFAFIPSSPTQTIADSISDRAKRIEEFEDRAYASFMNCPGRASRLGNDEPVHVQFFLDSVTQLLCIASL